jgi:ATP-binding cassette subfamily D (ALD) protein 3
MFAVPASLINSALDYLNHKLAIQFRARMSEYLNKKYLQGMVFYQMSNLDVRISHPDQRFTQDIDKWASCLSNLYSNISKPLLDIFLFSRKLSELVGIEGPLVIIGWYFLSGIIIRFISPQFGRLTAQEQRNEGLYRACHSDLVNHSEEIAFYRGNQWEKMRLEKSFKNLIVHINDMLYKRFYMGTFDCMLVKYGAVMVAYFVLGLPVFGPNREKYLAKIGNDPSAITRDYIRNSNLLINLAKAIGRLVVSYKDLQSLAGYTGLIYDTKSVLDDLEKSKYKRTMVPNCPYTFEDRGTYVKSDEFIRFENVPIVAPNGDVLVERLSFEIKRGMHTFIQGPNGCGKSSLFRILGELWPLFAGTLYKPEIDQLFYIPQRPYLPNGTLRDQIIYPHTQEMMARHGYTDEQLFKLMETVKLTEIVDKRGGFDQIEEWNDTLSGGQKQRIAMCRLLYHKPKFAILDECTSAVSMDVEGAIYEYYKECGITLITVSHRESLLKYHNYILKFDGEGGWTFSKILSE